MNIIQRNLFTKLRIDNFQTKEEQEAMSRFKMKKLMALMKNIADMPAGEVTLSNPLLNKRLKKIQKAESQAAFTPTLYTEPKTSAGLDKLFEPSI